MNPVLDIIRNRRSVRVFQTQQIKPEELQTIIDAGLWAPSAVNQQSWHFTVIQNRQVLDKISAAAKQFMLETNPDALNRLPNPDDFDPFHHAPTAIIVSGRNQSVLPEVDCAAATQNMLLAAESIGVSTCWIGSARQLFTTSAGVQLEQELGIPADYTPYWGIALGYKGNAEFSAPPRQENTVHFIR